MKISELEEKLLSDDAFKEAWVQEQLDEAKKYFLKQIGQEEGEVVKNELMSAQEEKQEATQIYQDLLWWIHMHEDGVGFTPKIIEMTEQEWYLMQNYTCWTEGKTFHGIPVKIIKECDF